MFYGVTCGLEDYKLWLSCCSLAVTDSCLCTSTLSVGVQCEAAAVADKQQHLGGSVSDPGFVLALQMGEGWPGEQGALGKSWTAGSAGCCHC